MLKLLPKDPMRYGLAVLSGLLLGFSYPPFGLWAGFLAFLGLVPILGALDRSTRFRDALKITWVGMFFFGLSATWWVGGWYGIGHVDRFLMLGGVMLMVVHPIFLMIPLLLYDVVRRRFGSRAAVIALPIFYAGFEYSHSFGDLSFPWLSLYNSQTYNTAFVQFIEFTGPFALTGLIVIINILLFSLLKRKESRRGPIAQVVALVLLLVLPYIYGAIKLRENAESRKTLAVTVLQPNINPWAKWDSDQQRVMDTNYLATRKAILEAHGNTQLLIWPETAIPFPITTPSQGYYLSQFNRFLDSIKSPILTGFPDEEFYFQGDSVPPDAKPTNVAGVFYRTWNAAMLDYRDDNGRQIERYHKQILVPLGEHVPFIDALPFLGKIFKWSVGLGSWNRGTGYDIFGLPLKASTTQNIDTAKISTLICYESIYPSFVRHFVDRGAELLVIITNDGWYGKSPGPFQHNQFAVLRAIENRRWIVRSANTGISSIIDDRGRIVQQTPLFEQTSLTATVPLNDAMTLYSQWGDFFAIPCEWVTGLVALYFFGGWLIARFRRKKAST